MGMRLSNRNTISTRLFSEKIITKEDTGVLVPTLKVEADWTITGKNGERKGIIECHCFVKQFGQLLHLMFGGLESYSVKDTAGATKIPTGNSTDYQTLRCNAPAGADGYGIVVGLNNLAVDIADYKLESKCSHGTGLDEFSYGGPVSFNMSSDATSNSLVITRTFANNSVLDIAVKELGLIVSNASGKFLVLRDIVADPGLVVATTEELTINYKIKAIV